MSLSNVSNNTMFLSFNINNDKEIIIPEVKNHILPHIPMTSDTEPYPYIASASSSVAGAAPWKMFKEDHLVNWSWGPNNTTGAAWCALTWQSPQFVIGYEVHPSNANQTVFIRTPQITLYGLRENGTYQLIEIIPKPTKFVYDWMPYMLKKIPEEPYYGLRWNSTTGRNGHNWQALRVLIDPL